MASSGRARRSRASPRTMYTAGPVLALMVFTWAAEMVRAESGSWSLEQGEAGEADVGPAGLGGDGDGPVEGGAALGDESEPQQ